jgi:hypothetical protein
VRTRLRTWKGVACLLTLMMICWSSAASAQTLTGQIGGTVVDGQGAAIPGATVTVTNTATRGTREAVTDAQGAFVVTGVLAGTYDLRVALTGFRTYEQRGLVVSATERVALASIQLQVGGVSETVSVAAEGARIQTQSGERSATITADQIQDIGLKGRDFMGTLQLLPGVIDTRNRDAPGWGSVGGMTINGQSSFNFSYDGIVSKDTGSNSGNYAAPALDSIAEVKVQTSNFQAEYGRSSGASITVVTKSGSSQFRGSGAYYKRHEALNANPWDRTRQCEAGQQASCSTPRYRYDNIAWTIGGPVLIPGTEFNSGRDKLFFFFSQDLLPRTDPGNLQFSTMPTARERAGDFSQTFNSQGALRYIRDPQTNLPCNVNTGAGGGCFPGNVIPADRINPIGQMMLNLLPMPNADDPTGNRQYNYTYQNLLEKPKHDNVGRVDWNIAPGSTFYTRLGFSNEVNSRGANAFLGAGTGNGGGAGWPQFETSYGIKTYSLVNTFLRTINPSTVAEITIGMNWAKQYVDIVSDESYRQNDRRVVLNGLPQFFPEANPQFLVPNMSWGGTNALPNTRGVAISNRFPFNAKNIIWNYNVSLTKLMGSHNLKAGVFIEKTARPAPRASTFQGSYNFNGNASNPFDTNLGWANGLLGSINNYEESTAKPFAEGRYNQTEAFVQDNWRIRRNFTLDYGVRMYYIGPTFVADQDVAHFTPDTFSGAAAPLLFQPVCANGNATCSGSQRVARNPLTGEVVNNTFIGKLVPGSGDFYNGMTVERQTVYDGKGILFAPRAGFAWDVTGDGRTAIRGGAGVFYDRYSDDIILSLVEQPPLMDTRVTDFTTIPQLLQSQLIQSPRGVQAFDEFEVPTVYNWSLGVQRQLPWQMVGDVAYVGNANRNNPTQIPINSFTYGTTRVDLNPQNADPTQNNGQSIPADYLRPYRGFGGINLRQWNGYANYHSIQVSVNRRMSNGFAWGASYTGSRRFSRGDRNPFMDDARDERRNYSKNGSRPHVLSINYNYVVPDASQLWDNTFVRLALDGWQVSGITSALTGTWTNFGYSFSGAPFGDMTGGPGGSRVALVCDPTLPRGERTLERQFRTECIQMPGPTTDANDIYYLGTDNNAQWLSPGYINHDLTLFKNFRMTGNRNLQFRMEFYNLFNSNQFTVVDTGAQFNFATGAQTDNGFGTVTNTRAASSRIIQLGLRFTF